MSTLPFVGLCFLLTLCLSYFLSVNEFGIPSGDGLLHPAELVLYPGQKERQVDGEIGHLTQDKKRDR